MNYSARLISGSGTASDRFLAGHFSPSRGRALRFLSKGKPARKGLSINRSRPAAIRSGALVGRFAGQKCTVNPIILSVDPLTILENVFVEFPQ